MGHRRHLLDHEAWNGMLASISKTGQRGFTLVELLVGLAVLGILMASAIPSYRVWIQNVQIRNAAESIQNGLQRARSEAIKRNQNVEFVLGGVAYGTTGWSVHLPGVIGPTGILDSRLNGEGSKNVIISGVSPGGTTTVTFDNTGRPIGNLDASLTLKEIDLDSSVLSATESQDLHVTINAFGRILMCDPHATIGKPTACN